MKHLILFGYALLTLTAVSTINADFLDCNEERFVALPDNSGIGPKTESAESAWGVEKHEVRQFLKSIGCQIKKGASKVKEQAQKLGSELKVHARKLTERAKVLGSEFKTKFIDLKEHLKSQASPESNESENERKNHALFANVELINPDILRAEQECGHGHILDALGNCRKLRK